MQRRNQGRAYHQAILCGCLLIGLTLGACSGDDDSGTSGNGGQGGSLSFAGSLSTGASAGEPTNNGGGSATANVGGSAGVSQEPAAAGAGGVVAEGGSAVGGGLNVGGGAGNGLYLPCASLADCKVFGGGKICCAMPGMQFCTKQSACSGNVLP